MIGTINAGHKQSDFPYLKLSMICKFSKVTETFLSKSVFRTLLSHFLWIATSIDFKFQFLLLHLLSGRHDGNELQKH